MLAQAQSAVDQGLGPIAGGSAVAAFAIYALRLVWNAYQRSLARIDQVQQEAAERVGRVQQEANERINKIQQERLDDAKEQSAMLATTTALLERNTRMLERQVSSNQAGGG